MSFTGFEQRDFDTFKIAGLDERMEAIRNRIQPKFKELGAELADYLSAQAGNEMFLHIAQHARRSVNPPDDTWMAIAANKRGYKKHPHFQVGLFDDHVFIWLALIYELPQKDKVAAAYLDEFEQLKQLPDNYAVSLDHMKKDALSISDLDIKHLERFRDVKKAEFLIGRKIDAADPVLQDSEAFENLVKEVFNTLFPYYRTAVTVLS